jgi:hypothetical protein
MVETTYDAVSLSRHLASETPRHSQKPETDGKAADLKTLARLVLVRDAGPDETHVGYRAEAGRSKRRGSSVTPSPHGIDTHIGKPISNRVALGVAINAGVLAHDVLNGFDDGANGHASILNYFERGFYFLG